jgi:hypothetical protein
MLVKILELQMKMKLDYVVLFGITMRMRVLDKALFGFRRLIWRLVLLTQLKNITTVDLG